jgi:hypothetical protein
MLLHQFKNLKRKGDRQINRFFPLRVWEGELDTSLMLLQTFVFYSMEGKPGGT